jgi:cysteinyl-tRNA synthetase
LPIRIYDTLKSEKVEFVPQRPGHVGMYVCGMTVQDVPHVGHMRSSIAPDVIRRYLIHKGFDVTFVYNFTDVDDKIIEKAAAQGISYQELAKRNEDQFLRYASLLNMLPATHNPRATEHIGEIQNLISTLIDKGHAYHVPGGDVYYRVRTFDGYGKLSKKRVDDLRSGARIGVDEKKEDPLDFVLWKAAKPGEPAWDSPWGRGRPGWHIECSAMSQKYLGSTFDIHGGGQDLIFPHHENEIAQSEAANGVPFVNYWTHNGWVTLGGEKMSKSTKLFRSIEEIAALYDVEAIRFYLISTHYRSPIEFSEERLTETSTAYLRLRRAVDEAASRPTGPGDAEDEGLTAAALTARTEFEAAMDDDFNTARAVGVLFDLSRPIHAALERQGATASPALKEAALALRELGAILGLFWTEAREETVDPGVQELVNQREAARKSRNWAEADRLRAAILERGYSLEDRSDGPRVRRKQG